MTFEPFFKLCAELDRRHVAYEIRNIRENVLMIRVSVPGERWELEFFEDGSIELERFVSAGVDADAAAPTRLLEYFDRE
jgi:hypothetical protein